MAREKSKQSISEDSGEQASFVAWFMVTSKRDPRVKAHHMTSIRAHFKSLGLSDRESTGAYDKALKNYGL
jgi:hypothetical protein